MQIEALFLDVGGVLGSNGWGTDSRRRACAQFGLDEHELNERHRMVFDAYETGKVSLDEYLAATVFHQPRPFSPADFRAFMLSCSQPYPEMLELIAELRRRHGLRISIVSNEGRELALHRIELFNLRALSEVLLFSAFAHLRKPDPQIYELALDLLGVERSRVLVLDDRPMFIETSRRLGLHGLVPNPSDLVSTRAGLAEYGLTLS